MSDEPILPSKPADKSGPTLPSERPDGNEPDRSSAPQLPADEKSSEDRLSTRRDNTSAGSSQAHNESIASSSAKPQSSEEEDLEALIRRLTANESLGEEVPDGYEHPGRYWKSVQAEDPFMPLLLDPRQYNAITNAAVEHHTRVVKKFWQKKIGFMEHGGGGNIDVVYGDRSRDKVRGYLQKVLSCRERIRDPEDRRRAAEDLLNRRREEAWRHLRSQIRFTLQGAEILSSQVTSILDAAEEEGIERETARERLHRRFRSEGFEGFSSEDGETRWMKPDEYERRKKERRAAQIPPIRIGPATAQTIDDLITLCDEYPEAASRIFHNGYVDKWVGGNYGDTDLANELAAIREKTRDARNRAVGLERAVRVLSRHAGRPATPQITLSREAVEFGALSFGRQVKEEISIRNASSRRMWGRARLEGMLPGVSVTDPVTIGKEKLRIALDTTEVGPGVYTGRVVFIEGGTSTRHVVALSYEVEPVQFRIDPESLHLGVLGRKQERTVTVAADPALAIRYLSMQWVDAWAPSVQASPDQEEDGRPIHETVTKGNGTMSLDLTVDIEKVQDRRSYSNTIEFTLPNGQAARVPFSFRRPWRHTVPVSVATGAVVFGAFFSVSREKMGQEAPVFEDWVLSLFLHADVVMVTTLFTLVLLLIIGIPVSTSVWLQRRPTTQD